MLDLSFRPDPTSRPEHTETGRPPASDDLLAAAERDAAAIVDQTRAEITRAVLKARQGLIVLTSQLNTGVDLTHRNPGAISRLDQIRAAARHDLLRTLREARPDLSALSSSVALIAGRTPAADEGYRLRSLRMIDELRSRLHVSKRILTAGALLLLCAIAGFMLSRRIPDSAIEPQAPPMTGLAGAAAGADAVRGTSSLPGAAGTTPTGMAVSDPRRDEILRAAERWIEAYYAGDKVILAALSIPAVTIRDDRRASERPAPGLREVVRKLGEPDLRVFESEALLTAKLIERGRGVGRAGETVSFISQLWTYRAGAWRITDVRIASVSSLQRALKK